MDIMVFLHQVFNSFVVMTTEHMQDIVGLLFRYISLLRKSGICKWIFDEVCVSFMGMCNFLSNK